MVTWKVIAIIAGFVAAIGFSLDILLINRKKPDLHDRLTNWWFLLESSKFQQLPVVIAKSILDIGRKSLKWPLLSWKFIIQIILASWILTTLANALGAIVDSQISKLLFPPYILYVVNFPFDIITILMTIKVLQIIRKKVNLWYKFIAAIADILVAFILFIICFASLLSGYNLYDKGYIPDIYESNHQSRMYNFIREDLKKDGFDSTATIRVVNSPSYVEYIEFGLRELELLFYQDRYLYLFHFNWTFKVFDEKKVKVYSKSSHVPFYYQDHIIAATTFIPTLIYMSVMLILFIGAIFIKTITYLLEVATQWDPTVNPDKFKPFTLLGFLIGIIAVLAKSIAEIIELYYLN